MEPNSIVIGNSKPEWLSDLQVMSLKPGDVVVLKFKDILKAENQKFIREQWKKICEYTGITNKLIILENGTEIGVLSPEK